MPVDALRSIFTENRDNLSVGSICVGMMVTAYVVLWFFAFFMKRIMPLTGIEFATVIGAVYGIKKTASTIQTFAENKAKCEDK